MSEIRLLEVLETALGADAQKRNIKLLDPESRIDPEVIMRCIRQCLADGVGGPIGFQFSLMPLFTDREGNYRMTGFMDPDDEEPEPIATRCVGIVGLDDGMEGSFMMMEIDPVTDDCGALEKIKEAVREEEHRGSSVVYDLRFLSAQEDIPCLKPTDVVFKCPDQFLASQIADIVMDSLDILPDPVARQE